ncbi:MAG: PKD domain-containing protein [Microthrixaceae bacterium]
MTPTTRARRSVGQVGQVGQVGRVGQGGFTLLETMITVMLAGLIMAPIFGWAFVASRQQAATITRNIDGASVGLLRTYFLRDVASASGASAGTAANGGDCSGGTAEAAAATDTLLNLASAPGERVIYNRATASDGDGLSIWRRVCTGATATTETELIRDIEPSSLDVSCAARPGMPSTDCGRISLRVTTDRGRAVSMSASLRAGVAVGAVSGGGGGSTYVSPDVTITASAIEVYRGESVTFDATATMPSGETPTSHWDLGDGTTASTASVTHSYSSLGEFTAVYTATTAAGTPSSDYIRIQVRNRPPTAVISSPSADPLTVNRCQSVSFAANGSADNDSGGSIVRYVWDYGDGDTSTQPGPASHTHAFAAPRSPANPYSVSLRVEDNDHDEFGNGSDSTSTDVIVDNRAPNTPTITGSWGGQTVSGGSTLGVTSPATVAFSATASDPDGSCDTLSYQWLVDGDPVSGATSATYSYTASGSKQIKVRITDDQGESKTSSAVTVSTNSPPSAAFTLNPTTVRTGVNVTVTNDSSDAETAASGLSYAWTFEHGNQNGTNSSSSAQNPGTVEFSHNGSSGEVFAPGSSGQAYTVTLTVTDPQGGTATTTRTVNVTGAPKPTGLSTSGFGCSGFLCLGSRTGTMSWSAVSNVTQYEVRLECDWWLCGTSHTIYTTSTSVSQGGLPATSSSYNFRVRARDSHSGRWGEWSDWKHT